MTWLERMNSAMDYIERNLTGTIDYTQLAQITCCSVYHFQRMFSFISGVALSEYIQETAFLEVPKFCIKCDEDGSVDRMNALLGRSHDTMLHAALYDYMEDSFKYMICQ